MFLQGARGQNRLRREKLSLTVLFRALEIDFMPPGVNWATEQMTNRHMVFTFFTFSMVSLFSFPDVFFPPLNITSFVVARFLT